MSGERWEPVLGVVLVMAALVMLGSEGLYLVTEGAGNIDVGNVIGLGLLAMAALVIGCTLIIVGCVRAR